MVSNILKWRYPIFLMAAAVVVYTSARTYSAHKIDFNTQIKPLFNKHCISCHGGVKRKGGFSLLFRHEALSATESGKPAIIPGKPDESEFIRRLTLTDPEERMPYKETPLSKNEINLLRQWVKEGAEWGDHWAYQPVQPVEIPKPKARWWGLIPAQNLDWQVESDIDFFIYDKIKNSPLKPSPRADKQTLLRRTALDIIGLPASDSLQNAFLNDVSGEAFERLVDALLASPQFGERWTAMWLDLARYADTKGYERDDNRSIWRYRDWLINAFNQDKPYNSFLTEQIAGDLLPNATDDQLIATAFHRNTMTNDEGGTDNEEFRTAAVIDRVNTTWEALMGTTFSCVQCHSHPYDPFKHEDYYKFLAFFNNTRDEDTYADYPLLREYKKADSLKLLSLQSWLHTNVPHREKDIIQFVKTLQPAVNTLQCDKFINSELNDTKWLALRKDGSARIKNIRFDGKDYLIFPYRSFFNKGTLTITLDSLRGQVLKILPIDTVPRGAFAHFNLPKIEGTHDVYIQYSNPTVPKEKKDYDAVIFDWLYFTQAFPGKGIVGYEKAEKDFWDLLQSKNIVTTPILMENPADMRRKTYVFERGNWLVQGDEVQPDVPDVFPKLPDDAPRNRLGLALWLTDTKNPLTARTYVNRIWEQIFGQGLAETLEDLGTQGLQPTHRELLDYLAYQFMHEWGWSTKKLIRAIVLSATYQQDSKMTEAHLAVDPFNKLYARAPRVRLSAEQIRDQVLAVSGLLFDSLGGKSVFPYQPPGIWSSPWNGDDWQQSTGNSQYRRSVYTYWKRSSPYPAMITFDGVNREICVARRIRTNTPLQALTSLNDSSYIVAAVALVKNVKKACLTAPVPIQSAGGYDKLISIMYQKAIGQLPSKDQVVALERLFQQSFEAFNNNKISSKNYRKQALDAEPPDIAALAMVANAIMNLDAFVTKT